VTGANAAGLAGHTRPLGTARPFFTSQHAQAVSTFVPESAVVVSRKRTSCGPPESNRPAMISHRISSRITGMRATPTDRKFRGIPTVFAAKIKPLASSAAPASAPARSDSPPNVSPIQRGYSHTGTAIAVCAIATPIVIGSRRTFSTRGASAIANT
jgi:hypothetical protein